MKPWLPCNPAVPVSGNVTGILKGVGVGVGVTDGDVAVRCGGTTTGLQTFGTGHGVTVAVVGVIVGAVDGVAVAVVLVAVAVFVGVAVKVDVAVAVLVGVTVGVGVLVGVAVGDATLKLSVLQSELTNSLPARHNHTLYPPPGFGVVLYGDGVTKSHNEVGPKVPSPLAIVTTPYPTPKMV